MREVVIPILEMRRLRQAVVTLWSPVGTQCLAHRGHWARACENRSHGNQYLVHK